MEILDLFTGDQLKPEYLSINPNGVVPALVHDDKIVLDSSVIIEYLEDINLNHNPLRPPEPENAAKMRAMIRYFDEVAGPSVRIPSYNMAFLPHFQDLSEEEFIALAESKPLRKDFLLKMGRTGFSEVWLEESGGPFLLGQAITYADICIMPVIVRMQDLGRSDLWASNTKVIEWLKLIQSSAIYEKTYCEGSLLSQVYPHLRNS